MSPYIFALYMNILSCMLKPKPTRFKSYWRCKELDLSYLFFADDVLFFAHGDKTSNVHVKDSIAKISAISGLYPGVHKSAGFFCNCLEDLIS